MLFVGGPKDGKREDFPTQGGYVQTAVLNPYTKAYPPPFDDSLGIEVHTYQIKRFSDGEPDGTVFEVAFHSTVKNPMAALIKGYRYHRKKRCRY
jgi:hypothetical protein